MGELMQITDERSQTVWIRRPHQRCGNGHPFRVPTSAPTPRAGSPAGARAANRLASVRVITHSSARCAAIRRSTRPATIHPLSSAGAAETRTIGYVTRTSGYDVPMKPTVDRLVHYVPRDGQVCLDAIITGVELTGVDLFVVHEALAFHVADVPRSGQPTGHGRVGTWHWPERIDE
jgi:hypothetical protein